MLKLVQTDWGRFDLALIDPDEDQELALLQTLIYAVLFTDAPAPASRVPERMNRRGWWADPEAGSPIWHVRRQPLSSAARAEALAGVRRALKKKAALTNLEIREVILPSPAGNVSRVSLEISGQHNGKNFLIRAPL